MLGDISRSGVRQLVCLQSEGGLTGPAWAGVAQLYICLCAIITEATASADSVQSGAAVIQAADRQTDQP